MRIRADSLVKVLVPCCLTKGDATWSTPAVGTGMQIWPQFL